MVQIPAVGIFSSAIKCRHPLIATIGTIRQSGTKASRRAPSQLRRASNLFDFPLPSVIRLHGFFLK